MLHFTHRTCYIGLNSWNLYSEFWLHFSNGFYTYFKDKQEQRMVSVFCTSVVLQKSSILFSDSGKSACRWAQKFGRECSLNCSFRAPSVDISMSMSFCLSAAVSPSSSYTFAENRSLIQFLLAPGTGIPSWKLCCKFSQCHLISDVSSDKSSLLEPRRFVRFGNGS